ncbi:MAG: hypothetical protein LBC27_10255 [Spirochaetaceae bacterium]|jgi:hypothetical protein|nr:hypothetical protein [Spirochaetaceae bacterium]
MEQMKKRKINDAPAYRLITGAFKRNRGGMTVADVVARTALPLDKVRTLVNDVADEYSAHISVTESGEILYSFPSGFTSKYRGFKAVAGRALRTIGGALKTAAAALFKVWIMVMLVGYFVLFMLIALAALVLSVAANSSSSDNRRSDSGGGIFFASGIFNFIIRIWFYSELARAIEGPRYGYAYNSARVEKRPKGKPLYKAIFSFVFGDGDPNANMETRERQALIAYIQANKGVISLPEFMVLTGSSGSEADSLICSYCAEYGGMPEVTEDGTVVYRFDDLLLRADKRDRSFAGFSAPLAQLNRFSSNTTKMNVWFCVINSVNLIFGSYFFINAMNSGHILTQEHFNASSYLYGVTYLLSKHFVDNPLPFITIGLGVIPFIFSLFFWFIPLARFILLKHDNEKIKLENLRKSAFMQIWDDPLTVKASDIKSNLKEASPKNMNAARERVIKDMGAYSMPDVTVDEKGEAVYSFNELEREKTALAKYRYSLSTPELGKVVFNTDE